MNTPNNKRKRNSQEKMLKNSLLPLLAWINKYKKNSDIYNEALYITKKLTSFLIGE